MAQPEARVRRHFDADAARFDAIYDGAKGPFSRWVDSAWRGVVRIRLERALELLGPFEGRTLLDVGCGSGRFCVAYAARGARRVVGIDFAPDMIAIARDLAERAGLRERCEYVVGSFPDELPAGVFDDSSAIGFFDYVADPVPALRAMHERTRSRVLISFPKAFEWRVPVRRLRFLLLGCPLHLYTKRRVHHLLEAAGMREHEVLDLGRDYLVLARGSGAAAG